MQVQIIDPVSPSMISEQELDRVTGGVPETVEIALQLVPEGPPSIESPEQEEAARPAVVRAALRAQESGARAVVVACVGDVGVEEARAATSLPVFGPGRSAMDLANSAAGTFTVLVATREGVEGMSALAEKYGYAESLASVRPIGIPIRELLLDSEKTSESLRRAGHAAVVEDGASSVIIGCTVAGGAEAELRRYLARIDPAIRTIEPLAWTITLAAEAVIALGGGPGGSGR